ncbi:hypothetical protein FSP39_014915 [Pinctada imbricata]|uniref:Right handed beta helix domain-containing protein n=1 Tax=Pinctada imbricata TaxID=66713 RepID=A0AA88XVT7_PINIB|nr:hypothetical protein FSP39_014915 [Pinctada imbricata]
MSSKFWTRGAREPDQAACLYVLKRRKDRKVIRVGRNMEHSSLKSALGIANDYDRIEIYPGIYDEQFEMSSKIPFEIIGIGELGSVILVVCIEQIALTGRVSNLVFRAPWFTNFILKVRTGYLQVDNCILEDGMVYVQNPGSCHVKFCTFRHATVIFQHLNSSIIENCEFSQTDSAAVTVEGNPRDDKNWTYGYMLEKISNVSSLCRLQHNKGYETAPASAYSTAHSTSTALTNKKLLESKTDLSSGTDCGYPGQSMGSVAHMSLMHSDVTEQAAIHSSLVHNFRKLNLQNNSHFEDVNGQMKREHSTATTKSSTTFKTYSFKRENSTATFKSCSTFKTDSDLQISNGAVSNEDGMDGTTFRRKHSRDRKEDYVVDKDDSQEKFEVNQLHKKVSESNISDDRYSGNSFVSDTVEPSASASEFKPSSSSSKIVQHDEIDGLAGSKQPQPENGSVEPSQEQNNEDVRSRSQSRSTQRSSRSNTPISTASGSDFFDDEEDSIGGFDSGSANSSHRGSSSSSSEDDVILLSDTESDFSDEEESVIMLTCPEHQQPRSVSALSIGADVQSICSQNQSEHIRIVHDSSMQKIADEVHGCLIHCCRMTQCKGALMVSLQAHAIVSHCDINSVGYGIRCIQNARVILLKNEIHHCRTSGIFMRLAATGLIAGNDIHSNCEAGIDIRKNADPTVVVRKKVIEFITGKRSGIVVLGSGRGQIRNNEIYQNKEAGVYILYRGNPIITKNQIYSGKAAGVAVNEGGRGYVQGKHL